MNAAVLAAALFAVTAHELSHALATHAVGGRVERLEFSLRNGSRTLPYYPYAERMSYWDPYVVVGAVHVHVLALDGVFDSTSAPMGVCAGLSLCNRA